MLVNAPCGLDPFASWKAHMLALNCETVLWDTTGLHYYGQLWHLECERQQQCPFQSDKHREGRSRFHL